MTIRWRAINSAKGAELQPLEPDEGALRLMRRLDEGGYRALAALMDGRPEVELWVDDQGPDAEFLAYFPGLRSLSLRSLRITSLDGVRHVAPTLEALHVGDFLKRLSLRPLAGLTGLTSLSLTGGFRDLEVLSELTSLESLAIGAVDLRLLLPLTRLGDFTSGLGRIANFDLLPDVGRLEAIELYRVRELRDVSALGSIPSLRRLSLESMSAIERLPSFAHSPELKRVHLDTMKGITDLAPIAAAPNLEELLLIEMCQLTAEHLRPLVGHPTLRRGVWGFCSVRKNREAYDLLPLGDPPYGHPAFTAWAKQRAAAKAQPADR